MFLTFISYFFFRYKMNEMLPLWKCLLFFLCLLSSFHIQSQSSNIGIPFTANYSNEIYRAGMQNWDIAQHPNGFLFFANNRGLLQYDGTNWQVFELPNKTIVRSLYINPTGKIYVGGQGEFGYFEPNDYGQLNYHSLLALLPAAHKQFSDVWEIIDHKGSIYFSASDKIYEYVNDQIKVHQNGEIKFIGKGKERVFIGNESGLLEIKDGEIIAVKGGEQLANYTIVDVVMGKNGQLIFATKKNGLFELNQNLLIPKIHEGAKFLKAREIYGIAAINEELIAISIISEGLVIMNKEGKFLYQLNKQNGLQNNNILSLFVDSNKNLWLGLNNGIDQVFINAPFSQIIPDKGQEGTAYTAKIQNNKIYLGTTHGLYQQDWRAYYNPLEQNEFQLLNKSKGQVWSINEIDQQLFMGHHEGGFVLKNDQAQKITPSFGTWTFLKLKNKPNYLIAGTYLGLELYHKEGTAWKFIKKYKELKESCRIMTQDENGNIWIAHPYRGIYKVQLAEDLASLKVKLYHKEDGYPCENLSSINQEVIFTGETGIYKYDEQKDTFLHNEALENLIGEAQEIRAFFEDTKDNIWYVTSTEIGILKVEDKGLSKSISKVTYPLIDKQLVRGYEFIYPYDANNVFIGSEIGFIHFDPSKENLVQTEDFAANIAKVEAINNGDSTLLYGQYQNIENKKTTVFPNGLNAFRFSYTTPNFSTYKIKEYSTKLEGFDQEWSAWSSKTEKEYTNLSGGDYRFLVKAKSNHNQISKIASYTFSIEPPWYGSNLAIFCYILTGLLLLMGLIFIPKIRFQRAIANLKSEQADLKSQQAVKEKEHQKVVAESEEAINTLKNKNLETEIIHKNKELALTTMHLVQRNELILKLQEPLAQILRKTTDKTAIAEIKRINKLLKEDAKKEESWSQFANHFDQVHVDFLHRIREQYPQLTANDRKLCAYLRMNLSTKEIAPLMNISIRGVEVGRYRLRKKIGLDSTVNLTEFMLSI